MGSTRRRLPADTFDGYELGAISRVGLAGQVWAARHVESGRGVEIEVIDPPVGADMEFRRRLTAEVVRAAVLNNPSIATVREVLVSNERVGVVADPFTPGAFHTLQGGDPLPLAATLFLADAVLAALSAAHRAGVVHGAVDRRVLAVDGTKIRVAGFAMSRALHPDVRAEPATDARAVARLVVELTGGSVAARYASLPQQLRVVLARAASARRERQYRTAAGLRSALAHAARRDLGEDWREIATAQLQGAPAVTIEPAASSRAAAIVEAPPVRRGRPPARPGPRLRPVLIGLALVVLALLVGILAGVVASAARGGSLPALGSLRVGGIRLQVEPVQGSCKSVFVATATAPLHGSGTIVYRWERSDGEQTANTALTVSSRDASFLISERWQLTHQLDQSTVTFRLVSPVAMSVSRPLEYSCP